MRKHVVVIILTPPSFPPPQKKMKSREAWKRGREEGKAADCQIGITIRQTQKPLTLYQKDSSFMTPKEVQIENVKKGEKCWLGAFSPFPITFSVLSDTYSFIYFLLIPSVQLTL